MCRPAGASASCAAPEAWQTRLAVGWLRTIRIYGPDRVCYPNASDGAAVERDAAAVYVCLCNALTDRQVKQAAKASGIVRTSEIYAACGCRAQCGQCARALAALLRGVSAAPPSPAVAT